MRMELLSDLSSVSGKEVKGMRMYTLQYISINEEFTQGSMNADEHHEQLQRLYYEMEQLLGSSTVLYDYMDEHGIGVYTNYMNGPYDLNLEKKVIDHMRLTWVPPWINHDNGVISFTLPKNDSYFEEVEKYLNYGMCTATAEMVAANRRSGGIVFNEKHSSLLHQLPMALYRPTTLKEFITYWDGIQKEAKK